MRTAKKSRRTRRPKRRAAPPSVNMGGPDRRASIGSKHVCFQCDAKFYDMNRPEPVCPRCGANQRNTPRQARAPAPKKRKPLVAPRMAPLLVEDARSNTEEAGGFVDEAVELNVGPIEEDEVTTIDEIVAAEDADDAES